MNGMYIRLQRYDKWQGKIVDPRICGHAMPNVADELLSRRIMTEVGVTIAMAHAEQASIHAEHTLDALAGQDYDMMQSGWR